MRIVVLVCQVLLGLMFLVFGLNGFLHFIPMPPPPAGSLPAQFMGVMIPSGWMSFVYACQILGGLLVLPGRTAPLGLCILGPIIVNVLCFHVLLAGGAGIVNGLAALLLWLVVLYGYRANFSGIFTVNARPTA